MKVYYIKQVDEELFWDGNQWSEEPKFYPTAREAADVMRRVGWNVPSPLVLRSTEEYDLS